RLRNRSASLGNDVTDGHHFNVGMILEAECRAEFAVTISDQSNPDLAIGYGEPRLESFMRNLRSAYILAGEAQAWHHCHSHCTCPGHAEELTSARRRIFFALFHFFALSHFRSKF